MPKAKRRSARGATIPITTSSEALHTQDGQNNIIAQDAQPSTSTTLSLHTDGISVELRRFVTGIVQSSVEELRRELRNEIRKVSNPPKISNPAPLTVRPSEIADAYAEINPSARSFQQLGENLPVTASLSSFCQADGGFSPDVPASFVSSIQAGEFFDLSKLLPENLHAVAYHDNSTFKLTVGGRLDLVSSEREVPESKDH